STSSTDNDKHIRSIDDRIVDRLCINILPNIHHYVKYLLFESMSMERILLAGNYTNLISMKLFNFTQDIALNYFTDESIFEYIFKYEIKEVILENNDYYNSIKEKTIVLKEYTKNVYLSIMNLFKNLKSLTIISSSKIYYPPLSIHDLPSTTFFSSILTNLSINVNSLDDCLYLLDGRLKQLITFILQIYYIHNHSSILHNTVSLEFYLIIIFNT
ncbi:unnamed protein product, partial [Rotaria sordida]